LAPDRYAGSLLLIDTKESGITIACEVEEGWMMKTVEEILE
jgi:hypothetical protein